MPLVHALQFCLVNMQLIIMYKDCLRLYNILFRD